MQDSSAGNGAGYEQELQSNAEGAVKGGKAAKKKVGSTMNKKANEGGKQVLHAGPMQCRLRVVLFVASSFDCLVWSAEICYKQVPSVLVAIVSMQFTTSHNTACCAYCGNA